jgi:hypothetical protein
MADIFYLSDNEAKKIYPNRVLKKTGKSEFDIQYENAQKEAHGKSGISFYSSRYDKYIFIESNR